MIADIGELKTRVTILETGFAGMKSELAGMHHAYAALQVQFGNFDKRMERIERRLDIHELAH